MKALFENNTIILPQKLIKKLKFKNKQNLEVEILDEKTIKIKATDENYDEKLKKYLKHPFKMGIKGKLNRETIYNDIT